MDIFCYPIAYEYNRVGNPTPHSEGIILPQKQRTKLVK